MNTLQRTNLKYTRNKRLHECPGEHVSLIPTENISIFFCHCHLYLRLASPNVNIFPEEVITVPRNISGSCGWSPLKCMKREVRTSPDCPLYAPLLSPAIICSTNFKYPGDDQDDAVNNFQSKTSFPKTDSPTWG